MRWKHILARSLVFSIDAYRDPDYAILDVGHVGRNV
jgi:hypothetical protein